MMRRASRHARSRPTQICNLPDTTDQGLHRSPIFQKRQIKTYMDVLFSRHDRSRLTHMSNLPDTTDQDLHTDLQSARHDRSRLTRISNLQARQIKTYTYVQSSAQQI
ncbi:hypothetical protein AVEN_176504-1 [Araneus ventricosus]|uniref:Uncharacterized protein n=1 Tax=Araneus ventricosus TaxID=182803 RepID=A0A4Y2TRL5_ARAVE|nr:hypothetical protein AVEN_176504-1 [Araneus ventricosus]